MLSVFLSSMAAYAFAGCASSAPSALLSHPGWRHATGPGDAGAALPVAQPLDLVSTYWGIIILYVAYTIPSGVFILTGFFKSIPREIEEAAVLDGCSAFGIYWRIVLPLGAPGVATLVILQFIWFWNEYLFALTFIQKEALRTVTLGVMVMAGTFQFDFSLLTAGVLISVVPTILIYIFFQRYLSRPDWRAP